MKGVDYSIGEKTYPLKKKNVPFYCNLLMEYAHDGFSLEYFLYDNYIRKSEWDKFVKKHKAIRQALEDAKYRAKGKAYGMIFQRMQTDLTPTLFKAFADNMLGWNTPIGGGMEDLPPPSFDLVIRNPSKPVSTNRKDGNGKAAVNVQATGHSGGNGKGGNGKG